MEKADFKNHIDTLAKPDLLMDPAGKSNSNSTDIENLDKNKHDPDEVWKIVKEFLRMNVTKREMDTWYEGVYIENILNGVATLSCNSSLKRDWIENYHKNIIRNKIEEVIGYKPDIIFSIRQKTEKIKKDDKYQYYDPKNTGQQSLFTGDQKTSHNSIIGNIQQSYNSNLNHKYLLDNFVVGKSNELAYAVSQNVVDNPGIAYNPVFFYGPSGVGKTHLMQAIGNAVIRRNPSAKVLYTPIENFLNEMIESIRTNTNEDFIKKYRPADLLIIDDIQFISSFVKTQEELFNTFNALYEANKQIVIASDRPPQEIDNLPDRLRTRFQGGMVVDIQSPDLETRIAILQQEIKNSDIEIPNDIIMFIAQNVENSVRELEGAITKVITLTKITQEPPNVEDLARMLQVDLDSKRKRVSPKNVIERVAEIFDVTPAEIKGKRRTAYVALARQVVMYLLREELQMPLEKVAKEVNRKDHTTVLHAYDKINELKNEDRRLSEKLEKCKVIFTA